MHAETTIALPAELSEGQRTALLKLLTDDDRATWLSIRQKIISQGPSAIEWLRPHCLSDDPVLRRRAQDILRYFERQDADNEFLSFCLRHGQDCDLEEGAWLLAQTRYPEINLEGYRALLDQHATVLREKLQGHSGAKDLLGRINDYLFRELAFTGNEDNYYDPQNSYLNRVLDRHTGNPINLCVVYMLLARRLRLPVAGIGLPGHFIARYQSSEAEIYVDAFNGGKLLAKADCVQYLLQGNYSVRDEYLAPVSPRRMLLRICSNLHQVYSKAGDTENATRLQRYIVALAK
jgi:regulator of sirC expression with transglutaminase-like and TPR domain